GANNQKSKSESAQWRTSRTHWLFGSDSFSSPNFERQLQFDTCPLGHTFANQLDQLQHVTAGGPFADDNEIGVALANGGLAHLPLRKFCVLNQPGRASAAGALEDLSGFLIGQRLFGPLKNPRLLHLFGEGAGVAGLQVKRRFQNRQLVEAAVAIAKP